MILLVMMMLIGITDIKADTFYWRGATSQAWNTSSNWRTKDINNNDVVTANYPGVNDDVIIGDAGFVSGNSPKVGTSGSVTTLVIKSLTIGIEKAASLVITKGNFTVNGNVRIGVYGTFENQGTIANYKGNFTVEESGELFGRYKESSIATNNGYTADNKELPVSTFSGTGTIKMPANGNIKNKGFGNLGHKWNGKP